MLDKAAIIERIRRKHTEAGTDGDIRLKAALGESLAIDRTKRIIKGIVSTTSPDLDDEVVVPEGLKQWYFPKRIKAVYLSHDYDQLPVGTCAKLKVQDGQMFASTFITRRAIGEDLLTAFEEGSVNGFSIGFRPDDFGPPTPEEKKKYGACRTICRTGVLIEYSVTPMPTNQDSLAELVSKSLIHRSSAVAFGLDDTPERKYHPVTTPKSRRLVLAGDVIFERKSSASVE